MKNLRKYGKLPESGLIDEGSIRPFKVTVIHGGPGAPGSVAPIARELSRNFGVLEPLQTGTTIKGQISELKRVLKKNSEIPIILVGHSWGAWLSYIFAARYPSMVKKLILVSSGPFEHKYVKKLEANRLSHLNQKERAEYNSIIKNLDNPKVKDQNKSLERLGSLTSKTDTYDLIPGESKKSDRINVQGDIFYRVWNEADELRRSGKLLALGKDIRCPVIATHGDYDPHPAEGVKKPLSAMLKDFRFIPPFLDCPQKRRAGFILLKNCGHYPWLERKAKDKFYKILRKELSCCYKY